MGAGYNRSFTLFQLTAFLGNAIIAFLVALVASLLYEAPVIRILKLIFRK